MKGYSSQIQENCASARLEGVNASYKDLAQVCGRIRNKKTGWALTFLQKAAKGDIPVLYKGHNKRLGHRRELGGRKGRYPKKAARIVLKVLESALANGKSKGLGDYYTILTATANKKHVYPRIAPKGRWSRSFLETARVEVIILGSEIPKGVSVTPPAKKEPAPKEAEKPAAPPKEAEKPAPTKEAEKPAAPPKEKKKPEAPKKKERPLPKLLKREAKETHEHKHTEEKAHEQEKKRKEMPHQHGEHDKR
jgi:large subunit ribosomal protein L22